MRVKSQEKMKEICKAVEDYRFAYRATPTVKQIADIVGNSVSTVHAYLVEMGNNGMISYSVRHIETQITRKIDDKTTVAPILGSIACGEPEYAEENFEEYVSLPVSLFGSGEFFILHTKGYSMIDAGIEPGDMVVVRKQNTADEGDIVVALVDNETTLKRYYTDNRRKCVRLHPENESMKDIYTKNCYIQGVAQNVIKAL